MAEKIICVVGPTACGKTKLGVLLAKRYDGEVVSADSMQIYKGMTIGTAAPTAEEMEGVAALSVPMKADSAAGQSWAEAKE
jgi:tRNA dimethylallyltransferase